MDYNLELFSIDGEKILTRKVDPIQETMIDLNNILPGMYLLKFTNAKASILKRLLII